MSSGKPSRTLKAANQLAKDYLAENESLLSALGRKLETLIGDLLAANSLRVHSVSWRVKDSDSLAEKLIRRGGRPRRADDITDILGLRIITYFPGDVDAVAEIIEREFQIDPANSIDRRSAMDPDRFGYLSLHYVAKTGPTRSSLAEYGRFADCRFEIQIRSILQHAWAEIEHDLGYKNAAAIPRAIQRRFSRLAGLLELADDEFSAIRDEVAAYGREVDRDVTSAPAAVLIDQDSLSAYVKRNQVVISLDEQIAALSGVTLEEDVSGLVGDHVSRLQDHGLSTIAELDAALDNRKDLLLRFATLWIKPKEARADRTGLLFRGVTLFFLLYLLTAESGSIDEILNYLHDAEIRFDTPSGLAESGDAQRILDVFEQAKDG